MKVFVLSNSGKPLMPTTQGKARKLLKSGKCKIVKHSPFTIKFIVDTKEYVQDITLGIDVGYSHIGFSCVSKNKEFISGTLEQESNGTDKNPTKTRMDERAMYRRNRRSRLRYRECRFDHRKREDSWITPSMKRKYLTHINLINKLHQLMPITKVVIEKW